MLGHKLIHETDNGIVSGWIVETEAYLGKEDAAAHSFQLKRTPRLASMYKPSGTIYVYQMHTHNMLNIVTKEENNPQAILIRAVEPDQGIEQMEAYRQKKGIDLTNGPGKLTKAFAVTKSYDGDTIFTPPLYVDFSSKKEPLKIEESKRVGIPNKGEWTHKLLRYSVANNAYVSRMKKSAVAQSWRM